MHIRRSFLIYSFLADHSIVWVHFIILIINDSTLISKIDWLLSLVWFLINFPAVETMHGGVGLVVASPIRICGWGQVLVHVLLAEVGIVWGLQVKVLKGWDLSLILESRYLLQLGAQRRIVGIHLGLPESGAGALEIVGDEVLYLKPVGLAHVLGYYKSE